MLVDPILALADLEGPVRRKRVWIPRETWRQEKAVVFARDAIIGPHKFLAHDRSQAKSPKEHLWQAKRGVRKGTPDTQLIAEAPDKYRGPFALHAWFEFKAMGEKPDDDQLRMLDDLRALGDEASWGVTIDDLRKFWLSCGVRLAANAEYRAMVLDGLVDSRIAKAEGLMPATRKRASNRKAAPRTTASAGFVRRAAAKGIMT